MAQPLPSERPVQPRPAGWALPRIGAFPALPPLLLVLLTLLALTAAYAVRPTVQIDMGDYYDSAYLANFHAREVDGTGAAQAWGWPADSSEITLPGGRAGDWMATVRAQPDLPGRPLGLVALAVNGQPVSIPRDGSHQFTAFIPAELAAAEQLVLRLRPALTGGTEPVPGMVQEVVLEPARTYRWSRAESSIALPGLGRGAWQLELEVVTAHPDGVPLNAQVLINDRLLAVLPETGEQRRVRLLVPAEMVPAGDMRVTLLSKTYTDPRPLGVLVAQAAVAPLQSASGLAAVLPPWRAAGAGVVVALALYACLALLLADVLPGSGRQRAGTPLHLWLAALAALAVVLPGAWALAAHRFPTSFMLPELAGLALWSLLLLLALRPLLRWLAGGNAGFSSTLLLIFFVGYWLKAGGMLYPYFVGIDIHWHMERVRWILDGQLPLLYGTESPLNESTMPAAEWGENPPVIPYSPYFHMFATLFALLPWRLEFSAHMLSALVDCSRVLIIGLLACHIGLSRRAALLAALLYALLPVTFLLHSWGNLPTTFGLWWAFAMTAWLLVAWPRLQQRGPFALLTLLILVSLLMYTVSGAFAGFFLVCFSVALWLAAWRSGQHSLVRGLRPLWLAAGLAVGLSLLIYYGQYIPPMIERTLPYFAQAFTQSHEETGRVGDTLTGYLGRHVRLADYGLVLPLVLTGVYLVWQWVTCFAPAPASQAGEEPAPPQAGAVLLWAAVAGWVAVMLVFVPLGYKISMVDKHFFAAVPMLVIASASVLERLGRYGWPLWGAVGLWYLYLGAASVALWLQRIASVQQG